LMIVIPTLGIVILQASGKVGGVARIGVA
jgi:hypothetical protein